MSSWKRTYWAVWSANLVTSIGMMSFLPFFPSLLEEMGVTDPAAKQWWAGAVFAAAPLSATVMSPVWGALGDRLGRKLMVCRAMVAICLFVGGMYWARTPLELYLLRLGQGFFSGFIPPSITLVSVAAPADRQGRVAGDLTTALALGGMVGPMLGGWIATVTGSRRSVFLFVAAAALLSALVVALVAEEDARHRQRVEGRLSLRSTIGGTLRDLRGVFANPTMRGAALLIFALQFSLGAVNPLLELYVRDLVHHAPAGFAWIPGLARDDERAVETLATSLLFGGMAVCNLLSLPAWGRYGDRVGHRRALVLCAVGSIFAMGLQAAATVYVVLFVGRMLSGVAMAGTGPLAFGLAAAEIQAERRGGAFGVVFSARTLAVAVGGTVGGGLASLVGLRGLMVVAAGVLALAVLPVAIQGRRARRVEL